MRDEPTRVLAPAKVNFGLHIRGVRPDGYHELESLFLPLDLADEIELEVASGENDRSASISFELEAGEASVPADERNLALRAASAFCAAGGLKARLALRLRKRIPVGAGLGGGSSDAAAVLRALVHRFPDLLSTDELSRLALKLGADVPFFLLGGPAWVSGIGDGLLPVEGLAPFILLLVNPGTPLGTPEVYRRYDEAKHTLTPWESGSTMRSIFAFRKRPQGKDLEALLQNDLEPAARSLCPAIGEIYAALYAQGAIAVGMSGSGATVFGVFDDLESAGRAERAAAFPLGFWTQVATTALV